MQCTLDDQKNDDEIHIMLKSKRKYSVNKSDYLTLDASRIKILCLTLLTFWSSYFEPSFFPLLGQPSQPDWCERRNCKQKNTRANLPRPFCTTT